MLHEDKPNRGTNLVAESFRKKDFGRYRKSTRITKDKNNLAWYLNELCVKLNSFNLNITTYLSNIFSSSGWFQFSENFVRF